MTFKILIKEKSKKITFLAPTARTAIWLAISYFLPLAAKMVMKTLVTKIYTLHHGGNLQDSVKIASNTDIKAISPDGKYILGTRFWDRQKNTDVIVNVEKKKYQMLLGRDYAKQRAFYSHHEDKFTYDFKGYLIYVAFPGSYPFDVLKWKNEEIPDWTEEEFWKQYEHPPLSEY